MVRKVFEGVLPPSDGEVDEDFKKALIVLDTNVLLDLYRYSRSTSEEYLVSIEFVREQLWMPYQVGLEFLRNRNTVRAGAHGQHGARIKKLETLAKAIEQESSRTHVGGDDAEAKFLDALNVYREHLQEQLEELRSWGHHYAVDETLQRLVEAYGDSVGEKPTDEWVTKHSKLADQRFKKLVPPGFADADTKEDGGYGDYFFWAQCLEECTERKLPLVLVTGDSKKDWIQHTSGNEKLGPRVELLQEFYDVTGQRLYIYNTLSFFDKVAGLRATKSEGADEARNEIEQTQRRAYESLMPELSPEVSERVKLFLEPRLKLKVSELLQNTRPFSASSKINDVALAALKDAFDDERLREARLQAMQNLIDDLKALNREADDDSEPEENP